MVKDSSIANVVNVGGWLKENENKFKPPVCNSLLANDYLKIMFVGGPNTRADYHLEQGEELFYMIKGDMCLKIMERGKSKDVHIKEGEVFVLPSRIPHSPQRNANTLGLVIERDRVGSFDGLRYYTEDQKILWQKFFNLNNLVEDLPPLMKEYFSSEQYQTGKPIEGTTEVDEKIFKVDETTTVSAPFSLAQWMKENREEIDKGGKVLFDKGEFKVNVYGKGRFEESNPYDTWVWLMKGEGLLETDDGKKSSLHESDSIMIPENQRFTCDVSGEDCYCVTYTMDKLATPQK